MPCLNHLSTGIAHGQTYLISISVTLNAVSHPCVTSAFPLAHLPSPLSGHSAHKKPSEAGTPSGFYLLSASPVRQHLMVHLHISVSLTGLCSFHLTQDPPTSPARPTVSSFTWQAVLRCVSPSLCPFNSVSALVLWETGSPSEHRKDASPQLLFCPVSVLSPHLCTPHPPNSYSVHSQGHKSVVVGMYYEEINIYHISFQEGE